MCFLHRQKCPFFTTGKTSLMSVTATVGLGSGYDQILVQLLNLELVLNLELGCASRLLLTAIINCSIVKHVKGMTMCKTDILWTRSGCLFPRTPAPVERRPWLRRVEPCFHYRSRRTPEFIQEHVLYSTVLAVTMCEKTDYLYCLH